MEVYLKKNKLISDNIECIQQGVKDNKNINVLKCKETDILFLDKIVINDDHYINLTEDYYLYDTRHKQKKSKNTLDYILNLRCNIIKDIIKETYDENKKLNYVDIGCGPGFLIDLLKKKNLNLDITAIELSKNCTEILKKKNIQCFNNISDYKNEADIVSILHLLEHIEKPIEFLIDIRKKMNKNGTLFIEIPHAKDILLSKYNLKEFHNFVHFSEHLVLYTKDSLRKIMELAGFKNIKIKGIQRYGLINHLYWLKNKTINGHEIWSDMLSDKLEEEYTNVLVNLDQTDTLICIAQS